MGARQDRKKRKAEKLTIDLNNNVEELSGFHIDHIKSITDERRANAPYNFVPLNKKIVKSDFSNKEVPFDKYHLNMKTGYIEFNITTLTPMYIRDNKNVDAGEDEFNPEFFSPGNGKLRIPGSSVRGLIKSMVEIVSYGKFGSYDDISLYFRSFDKSSLSKEYKDFGLNAFKNGNSSYEMGCGVLKKRGMQYLIEDCGKPKQIKKVDSKNKIGNGYKEFNFYSFESEYIVVSGKMQNKKNDWLIAKPEKECKEIKLSREDVNNYKNDLTRTDNINLLKKLKDFPDGIPCFYKQWKDDNGVLRTTIGHTGMFRIPYKKTISEHIPEYLKDKSVIDISDAIFGNETKFSGRVFVEDSFCNESDNSKILIGENHPKILSGPKPTTFQHYLTQVSEVDKELKHYNPDSSGKLSAIRGNKLYWHKTDSNDWKETDQVLESDTQHTKINPVRKDTLFTGRIRFENLSDVELGALLFVLDLPEGCFHKIGMGKPLGLGSIKITPNLHLSDREKRYTDLVAEWTEDVKESEDDKKRINEIKNNFADYVLKQLNGDEKQYSSEDLWDDERMIELRRMIDWQNKPDNDKTKYMDLKEFKNRPVLPKPTDVK